MFLKSKKRGKIQKIWREIRIKKIFPQKRVMKEEYLLLVIDHVMTKVKELEKLIPGFIEIYIK